MAMARKRKSPEASSASESSNAPTQNSSPTAIQNTSSVLVQNSHEFVQENIKGGLLDWLKEQPVYQNKSTAEKAVQENVIKDLADGIISVINQTSNSDNMDPVLLDVIKKHVQKFPVDPKKTSNQQLIDKLPTQILDYLKSLQLFQDISVRNDRPSINKIQIKKKAAVVLLEDIANWVNNLPIEANEETENTKEQLESKLIHKIGELNMNTEIFNDDFIYDDILGDEIDNLLENIPGENIQNNSLALKKDLLAIVKKARKKIRDENTGQIYKQQLCETISNTLPSFDLSVEGKASFEVLKDNVADAFINMRHSGNDQEETNKLKKKINEEIYKFCNSYLKRCPASPFDTTKLNDALYNALDKITEPQNESFINDVEHVKIKDEINNWAKELPLKNNTGQEKLHTNRMITVLAKKIHDIENEKDLYPAEEAEEKTKKEIEKFLKKLPLAIENNEDINELVEKLTNSLKDTEKSRKLNASARWDYQSNIKRTSKPKIRISFTDVSVSPCPISTCSQTSSSSTCPGPKQCLVQKSSSVQTPCKKMQATGSQVDVTPNVVVNEYHWDSIDESGMQAPRVSCPCPTPSRPPYVVMPQPLQSPISPREGSCMQPPRSSSTGPTATRPPCVPQGLVSQRESECTPPALKSCITTRQVPLQPFENKFIKPRDPDQTNPCSCAQHQIQEHQPPRVPTQRIVPDYDYDDYDYQPPENRAPFQHDPQAESTQAGQQSSDQSFASGLDENNSFQRGNQHSTLCQLPRTSSQSPSYPYHLSTNPVPGRPEQSPQRNHTSSQNSQYPRQPCPCPPREAPGQRNIQDSQYNPYSQCPGLPQMRNRRGHQDSQPVTPSPYGSGPPHYSEGQSCVTPRGSLQFSPSPQMPCAYNPRSPCYMRPEPAIPPEEYEPALNCSSQKSATHLGSYDEEEPQTCITRYQDWGKVRDDFEYWARDRQNYDPGVETNNRREGRRCKICKQIRYEELNGRRF